MAKHGDSGLGFEIVKAVINGDIIEPITFEKVKSYCKRKGIQASESHLKVILPNASENTHSPTYKKYFERVGRGEYVVLPEYRNQARYYWLNVDSTGYDWNFSDIKIGKSQTYSNLNDNGNSRKNPSCFNDIKIGDLAVAYETGDVRAITTLCKVVDKFEENNEIFVEFQKTRDYENALDWDVLKETKELEDCEVVHFHRGTLFELEREYFDVIVQLVEEINNTVVIDEELYQAVKRAMKDGSKKREARLESRSSVYPDIYEVTTKAFKRNVDVIAEVLIRAKGYCEKCGKEAPFKRATDGTPYLEVHHIKRLADGGEDTVENAQAVCPIVIEKCILVEKIYVRREVLLGTLRLLQRENKHFGGDHKWIGQ
ncbi:EVE domain-containing protein [Psychrobacillus psychrodurans]|uniref:HNH endonuclease n=1 Tax=Psychrobacillus psychrodurans TaxID=126157 RepID=UPI001F4DD6E8|nr:HNH endonuclease [Psychrobacillus psychrodurans]MCK1997495.1 EVE domain-containing protein [Psychrobacillus psychrodurans]